MQSLKVKKSDNYWFLPPNGATTFSGGCFLNDEKSKRQVLFSYLHYGGLV